jgi:hypothetical protein
MGETSVAAGEEYAAGDEADEPYEPGALGDAISEVYSLAGTLEYGS